MGAIESHAGLGRNAASLWEVAEGEEGGERKEEEKEKRRWEEREGGKGMAFRVPRSHCIAAAKWRVFWIAFGLDWERRSPKSLGVEDDEPNP